MKILCKFKSRRGFTLLEVAIAGLVASVVAIALGKGIIFFTQSQSQAREIADAKIEAAQLLLEISNIGKVARSCTCTRGNPKVLTCQVEFVQGTQETVEFALDGSNLHYVRFKNTSPKLVRTWKNIDTFSVCNGREIKLGNCPTTSMAWSGSAIAAANPENLAYYCRVRVSRSELYTEKGVSKKRGSFALETGLFTRNFPGSSIFFAWSPLGGNK